MQMRLIVNNESFSFVTDAASGRGVVQHHP